MKTPDAFVIFFAFLFPFLPNCGTHDPEDSTHYGTEDSLKIYSLNDAVLLNLVFDTTFVEPHDSTRNVVNGNLSYTLALPGITPDENAIDVRCQPPLFFSNVKDSLCFVSLQGIAVSGTERVYRQFYLLLVYVSDHWELADSIQNVHTEVPQFFSGMEKSGPYVFLKSPYEKPCYGGASAGENYLAIFENSFAPEVNISIELYWSDSCMMTDSPESIARTLEITYDDPTQQLRYTETEKYNGAADRNDYVARQRYLCYARHCCLLSNFIDRGDVTDTVFFMDDQAISLQVETWKTIESVK
ncbi:MAG TPA: hypothetical protein VK826_02530 [Bacteroidia bacterium]|nr:hypothetical protein [Bacteroidia bacterium]